MEEKETMLPLRGLNNLGDQEETGGSGIEHQNNSIASAPTLPPPLPPPVLGSSSEQMVNSEAPSSLLVSGVRPEADGWRAVLSIDLGTFQSADEATKAYDKAALMALGFSGCTTNRNISLPDIMARVSSTTAIGSVPQLLPAGHSEKLNPMLRGVMVLPGGSYVARLEIGAREYDLGPFASEFDAAKAYDKYSMLLYGVRAAMNLPPWEHLVSRQEVSTLVEALIVSTPRRGGHEQPQPQAAAPPMQ